MTIPTQISPLNADREDEITAIETPEAVAITHTPGHHFFGYYDKCPWDPSGRYVLALRAKFMDREPRIRDGADVGVIDLHKRNQFKAIGRTRAWNWQQGAMLQWRPGSATEIVYNDRRRGKLLSVVYDLATKEERTLPLPIYALSRDGKYALTLNFARLHRCRPGYGYVGVNDEFANEGAPHQDGIWRMDMETGEHRLIVALGRTWELAHRASMEARQHWFNHLQFSPDGGRFCFIHRWERGPNSWWSRLFTADPDGEHVHLLINDDMVSHFDWVDEGNLLAWARMPGTGDRFYVFIDGTDKRQSLDPEVLPVDGHCSYSPNRKWILTDTAPNSERDRVLLLYDVEAETRIEIGRFHAPPQLTGPTRCDLHPRWNRDGTQICIDSAHGGNRQMYLIDVAGIVAKPPDPEDEKA